MESQEGLKDILKALKDIKRSIKELVEIAKKSAPTTLTVISKPKKEDKVEPVAILETKTPEVITTGTNYPIPYEYREVVESVLNKEFRLEITPLSDKPAFQLSILVPKKYSNISPNQYDLMHEDRRSRVISFADGINGVRDWAQKVYDNLPQETKSMVVNAREQVMV